MGALAESRFTRATTLDKKTGPRDWIAADLTVDPHGTFLTGVLGYKVRDQFRSFDDSSWSWVKGETLNATGATATTVVPFAVDLSEHGRWVGFATSQSIRQQVFQDGFSAVLNEAVKQLDLWPTDWEFDLVVSRTTVRSWIQDNPNVVRMVRRLQRSNPGRDLDADRQHMRALGASSMEETYKAAKNETLDTSSPAFEEKLIGLETGDASLGLWALPQNGGHEVSFKSDTKSDSAAIDEFGSNLTSGMELVQKALAEYVASK
ncbi:hypothetical protein [Rhodococcus globerulus]|uniref:Uncharacterized protein n=1 Tax=Rhodococcus globerulus TaxID=33008 RepID=A0ABU4BSC8_RHOGO|nr:hypothetical protein [Rhodococcus globerulus]MDV6267093.1 hypothetical protein [Rhodococcus globerulus]